MTFVTARERWRPIVRLLFASELPLFAPRLPRCREPVRHPSHRALRWDPRSDAEESLGLRGRTGTAPSHPERR